MAQGAHSASRPGTDAPLTERSSRVVVARKLTRRAGREKAGAFLAEGAQAVREALAAHAEGATAVREVFATGDPRHDELLDTARAASVPVRLVTERAAASLSETVTPQGLVAVCDLPATAVADALAARPALVAVLVGISDPGNAGTVVRVADAAGAGAVLFAGDTVDAFNGKAVRASTGSLFHLPVARDRDVSAVFAACREAGLRLVGADGHATDDLDSADLGGALAAPTAWVFGSEAHGLPGDVTAQLDGTLRVPLYGRAESLNLATAAAVCLYASARAQHRAS
ncbi:TrmH family RNA methyltransferase [Saccharopolyspora erythraea]|uniref:TrmH family RNA methyltransferase n=1 Tax=Saccharopolyspora erythraea TaxID=1836 RepID=UPI0009DAB2C1|nr:RNA methyltransferase [Saccharopolyspora erythraea]QRK93815.1 RNA methyltransferase [Saccharopolyspora erythraea]